MWERCIWKVIFPLCVNKRKERGWKDWKVWKRKRDSKYHLSPTSQLGSSSKVGTAVQSPVSFKVEQSWPQVEFCRALVKVGVDVVQSRLVFQYENVEVSLNWNDTSFSYFSDTHFSEKLKAFIGVSQSGGYWMAKVLNAFRWICKIAAAAVTIVTRYHHSATLWRYFASQNHLELQSTA